MVYVSGQLPLLDGDLVAVGKVGDELSVDIAIAAVRQCAINAISALQSEVSDKRPFVNL